MALASIFYPNTFHTHNIDTLSLCTTRYSGFASNSSLFGSKLLPRSSAVKSRTNRLREIRPISASHEAFDVVVIGAGIIGLSIARQLLIESDLSVAVVDKAVPCSGATGAGQGYLWMVHKTPGSEKWDLAMRSYKLWNMLAESLQKQGLNPLEELGWKKTGSILVGRTHAETDVLKKRIKHLTEAGLKAEYLCSSDLFNKEPALLVDEDSGAVFLPDDCQLDAHRTVAYIEKANKNFMSEGRYAEFYNEPVKCLIRGGSNGEVEGVETTKKRLYGKKAIIVATGCWTGSVMHDLVRNWGMQLNIPVRPRKPISLTSSTLSHTLVGSTTSMESPHVGSSIFELCKSGSPFGLIAGLENSSTSIVSEKLTKTNFQDWSQAVRLAIGGHGKLGYITGATKAPEDASSPEMQQWVTENSLVSSWLINSMSPNLKRSFMYLPTARDIWEAVQECYLDGADVSLYYLDGADVSLLFDIKNKIWKLKQGDLDVTDYWLELSALWQELNLFDDDVPTIPAEAVHHKMCVEQERVFYFLTGLNSKFDDLQSRILGRSPLSSPREVYSEVHREAS